MISTATDARQAAVTAMAAGHQLEDPPRFGDIVPGSGYRAAIGAFSPDRQEQVRAGLLRTLCSARIAALRAGVIFASAQRPAWQPSRPRYGRVQHPPLNGREPDGCPGHMRPEHPTSVPGARVAAGPDFGCLQAGRLVRDGGGATMKPDLSQGRTFGAYRLNEVAGTGGMGVVYRAGQQPLGRVVALKVIRPEIAASGDYRARFLREARLAAAVDHPHIVSVFDFGEHAGRLYLTMQWIDGVELQRLIGRRQRLDPARAVRVGTQIALALGAVHDAGMLHRDVKPANILVRDIGGEDHAYLTDFGIAKVTQAQGGLTRTGCLVGTPGFLSPEQILGQQPDARSDLYALGCVMFEALAGQRPLARENDPALLWAHASSPRPAASQICPDLGTRYDAFLIRALTIDPDDRFQSAREFAVALQAAHTGGPGTRTSIYVAAPARPALPAQAGPPAPETTTRHGAGRSGPAEPAAAAVPAPPPAGPVTGAAPPGGSAARAQLRASMPASGYAARILAAAGCLVFLASVTVLHRYVNNGTGWKSLLQATRGDPASPLYANDFWIPVGLAAFVLISTAATVPARRRLPMGAVTVAALGLVGYILYIPAKGASPGFGPYGPSYWLSLAAAVITTLAAGASAIRSRPRGP